jgi:hypothetical protein
MNRHDDRPARERATAAVAARARSWRRSIALVATVAVAAFGMATVGLGAGVASATPAAAAVTTAPGGPTAASLSTTTFPLANAGYQASEYYLAGNASSYHNVGTLTQNGLWTVAADAVQQPYKTRIQVYRPIDMSAFTGTVIVEWLNVTNVTDSAADWILTHDEIIRQGSIYVGVTAQASGVNAAIANEGARYGAGAAGLAHPGDSFSYDIFSQAGQAVRDNQSTILGGGTLQKLIASGESQSATRMVTYIDALGMADHEYDGYFVHSRGTNPAALRQAPVGAISGAAGSLIRTDLDVPVFIVQTETDSRTIRQPDSSTFRDWEVAGSSHADMYTLGIGQPDTGLDNTAATALFNAMLHPTNDPLPGVLPPCNAPVNSGPAHWSVQAALHALRAWVVDGTPPAPSLYQQTVGGVPSAAVLLDANGIVLGGVRNPHVDAPVSTLRGVGQTGNLFCSLFGTDTPFSAATLAAKYATQGAFVSTWNASVDTQVALGYLLAADAPKLKFSAAATQVIPKSPLTVTANDQAITYGAADPSFTSQITGFVGSDTSAVLDTAPVCGVAGAHSAPGSYPIVCSGGADDSYTFTYQAGTLSVTYAFGGFLPPISNGTVKPGTTIPVKFTLTNAAGAVVTTAHGTVSTAKVVAGVPGPEVPGTSATTPRDGDAIRFDRGANTYIFNLSVKGFGAGTYRITVTLDDGTTHSVLIIRK